MNYDELNTLRQRMIQAGLDDVEEQYDSQLQRRGFEVERLPVTLPLISLQNIAQKHLNSGCKLHFAPADILFWTPLLVGNQCHHRAD